MMSQQRSLTWIAVLALSTGSAGCALDAQKGPEANEPAEGKFDSFRRPTEHGAFDLVGGEQEAELTSDALFHTWTVELSGPAELHAETGVALSTTLNWAGLDSPSAIDTVLYVYELKDNGLWGRYKRRNDDVSEPEGWSALTYSVEGPTTLRFLVKGYDENATGPFGFSISCEGEGCAAGATEPSECPFEDFDNWYDVSYDETSRFDVTDEITLNTSDPLSALDEARVIAMVGIRFNRVRTIAQAREKILFDSVTSVGVVDQETGIEYVGLTYALADTAFDPTVGAVFTANQSDVTATITEEYLACGE